MEKLSEKQRTAVSKLSTQRLTILLSRSGMAEEGLEALDRNQMLAAWAEIVLAGKDVPAPVAAQLPVVQGYDVALETRKFEFEMRRYEDEKRREAQQEQVRLEERDRQDKIRQEEVDRQERFRREELEARSVALEREERSREAELAVRKAELQRQRERDRLQQEKEQTVVHRATFFGDAMRNTFGPMPNDGVEIIAYFSGVEQLFKNFEVPDDLQAVLLKPYLSERARTLVSRMDPEKAACYKEVKTMLLGEYKLSPRVYLKRYQALCRGADETFTLFASRLKGMLTYYVDSRKVTERDDLMDLLLCDRVKDSLSDACLKHVLSVESTMPGGWLMLDKLCATVDMYQANNLDYSKPRVAAAAGASQNGSKAAYSNTAPPRPPPPKFDNNSSGPSKFGNKNFGGRTCHGCGSEYHLIKSCPSAQNASSGNSRGTGRGGARINACAVKEPEGAVRRETVAQAEPSIPGPDLGNSQPARAGQHASSTGKGKARKEVSADKDYVDIRDVVTEDIDMGNLSSDRLSISEHLAKLKYLDVLIGTGASDRKVSGLCDGGAEICVVRADVVDGLNLTSLGTVKLRGLFGAPVTANLVKLDLCLFGDRIVDREYVSTLCAVCPDMHDEVILTADVVDRLSEKQNMMLACNVVTRSQDVKIGNSDAVVVDTDIIRFLLVFLNSRLIVCL